LNAGTNVRFGSIPPAAGCGDLNPSGGRAALERDYPDAGVAARLFWDGFVRAGGRILRVGGAVGYDDCIQGDPVVQRTLDGSLFPIECAADLELSGEVWRVVLKREPLRGKGTLIIRLRFPAQALEIAERLLDVCVPPRIVIERPAGQAELADIYERVRAAAEHLRPVPLRTGEPPTFTLGPDHRLAPRSLGLQALVRGRSFYVEVGALAFDGARARIECDADMEELARTILGRPKVVRDPADAPPRRYEVELEGWTWARVGGLAELRSRLEEWIVAPLANPDLFRHLGLRPPRGVLLHGPPGTGKTLLAKVLACQAGAAFLYAAPRDLFSMWFGESEGAIGQLFDEARQVARVRGRALVFFDEIDGLFGSRKQQVHEASRRIMAQLLTEIDGLRDLEGVTVLAATNRLQDVDEALLRLGRFDRLVEVPLPDVSDRKAILAVHLVAKPMDGDVDLDAIAAASGDCCGADLEQAVARATFAAIRRAAEELGVEIGAMRGNDLNRVRIGQQDLLGAVAEIAATRAGRRRAQRRARSSLHS
jgi:hypothetical protein